MKDLDQKHFLVILQKPLLEHFCLNPVLCLEKKRIIVMTLRIRLNIYVLLRYQSLERKTVTDLSS